MFWLQGYSEIFRDESEILVGNKFEWTVRILVSVSTKNKYSILKYSSLLVLDNQNNIVAWV